MARCRTIKDGNGALVFHHIQHGANKRPRTEHMGLARLKVHRDMWITRMKPTERLNQRLPIIIRTRDVMASTEVEP